jgi:cysteinyl-tRNA synthetase
MIKKYISLSIVFLFFSCTKENADSQPQTQEIDYKKEMRNFVIEISAYSKNLSDGFLIIPQNGQELVTQNGEADGALSLDYLSAIDGTGREDLFYGYDDDNKLTSEDDTNYLLSFCNICEQNGVEVFTTDYCSTHAKMDDSYAKNNARNYISFAAPERGLNVIPDYPQVPFLMNSNNIETLADANNFLYLIDPSDFSDKTNFISAVAETNYDVIIMDMFFDDVAFTADEIEQLKIKQNGGKRLVVSYMSIGEAEDYRYYWNTDWSSNPPKWMEAENPDWPGNFKVKYWNPEWKAIVFGNSNAYLDKLIAAGFDGVYLDIIDGFEYFEEQ